MKKLLLLSLASILFVACSEGNNFQSSLENEQTSILASSKKTNDNANYYPLKKDMAWTYKLTQSRDGQSNNKFKEMTMSVVDEKNEDGFKSYVLKRYYPNSSIQPNQTLAKVFSDHIELSRYIQQEVFNTTKLPSRTKDYIISMKIPMKDGESWEGRDFSEGTELISVKGYETITVPFGTFDCIKINHHLSYKNGKSDDLFYWYAPNIGMIKLHEEITIQLGDRFVKMAADGELTNFNK